jgi:acyl carrier protein
VNTDRAREILNDALAELAPEVDLAGLDPTASLRDQADLDSVDFLELVSQLSRAVQTDIPEDDYDQLDTVDGAVAYLAAKLP